MIQYLDCIYRVFEKAEMLSGQFDLRSGTVCGVEHLFQLDIKLAYDYTVENYAYYREISRVKLYNILCKYPQALAAINYNNIGAIVIFRHRHSMYLFASNQFVRHTAFAKEQFNFKTEVIGIVKTPLKTYETLQPVSYLVVDKSLDIPVVHTAYGKKIVQFDYDSTNKPDLSRFLEMCNNEAAYASIEQKGKIKFIYIDGDRLKTIRKEG